MALRVRVMSKRGLSLVDALTKMFEVIEEMPGTGSPLADGIQQMLLLSAAADLMEAGEG